MAPKAVKKAAPSPRRGAGRPPLEHEPHVRARLLEEATRLFARGGYEKTSTREVAAAADCNASLIAYYFGGKEGLYKAMLSAKVEAVHARFPPGILDPAGLGLDRAGFREAMRGLIALNVAALNEDPEFGMIAQREIFDGAPRGRDLLDGLLQRMLEQLIVWVDYGKTQGYVRAEVETTTFLMLLSRAVEGYFGMVWALRGRAKVAGMVVDPVTQAEAFVKQVELAFLDGLLA